MKIPLICAMLSLAALAAERPNILLITADDLGMQLGCYGDAFAATPHLDQLAAGGSVFTRAYVTHSSCSSSRASILTGLYPHQNGQIGLAGKHPEYAVKPGIATLPELLGKAGYHTALIGKLHLVPAKAFPFDWVWRDAIGNPLVTRDVRKVADLSAKVFEDAGERPFFLYLNYFDPHRPYDADANQSHGLPENPCTVADVPQPGFLGGAAQPDDLAAYYNCIRRLDAGIGMLLDALQRSGKADNTLVIFLGDNGPPFGRAKATCYEAGLQVPFIVRWPAGGKAGVRSDALVSTVDIMPTLLEAAGAAVPETQGRTLRGLLHGEVPAGWRTRLFAEFTSHDSGHFFPIRSVREGSMKLIHHLDAGRPNPSASEGLKPLPSLPPGPVKESLKRWNHPPEWELYDLEKDPHERVNLAGEPHHAADLERLRAALRDWRVQTRDPLLDGAELQRLKSSHSVKTKP